MVKVTFVRFWFKQRHTPVTEESKAWIDYANSATVEALLSSENLPVSTTIGELRRMLQEEAIRKNPQDDDENQVWNSPIAQLIADQGLDFAFTDRGDWTSRIYFDGDDNTTVQELLKQRSLAETDELRLFVVGKRPPPGNLFLRTSDKRARQLVALNIPEEKFQTTTINEVVDMFCLATGIPREDIRRLSANYSNIMKESFDRWLDDFGIGQKQVIFVFTINREVNIDPPVQSAAPEVQQDSICVLL
jgi:hypothetical protein